MLFGFQFLNIAEYQVGIVLVKSCSTSHASRRLSSSGLILTQLSSNLVRSWDEEVQ